MQEGNLVRKFPMMIDLTKHEVGKLVDLGFSSESFGVSAPLHPLGLKSSNVSA